MTKIAKYAILLAAPPALGGCISSLGSIVTAPIKAVGKIADWTTTSQDEADRNRGRELRRQEQRLGKLAQAKTKYRRDCEAGDCEACARIDYIESEIAEEQGKAI